MTASVVGTDVTCQYTEPTTNSNGTPLADLHHTSIYYDMGNGAVHAADLPASLMTGGGTISYVISVPVADGEEKDVKFWATATDTLGNTSLPSPQAVKRIDRLAPAPPF